MKIIVNGEAREVPDGATVQDALIALGMDPEEKGIAVAVDGEVVFRKDWREVRVKPGSRVEVVKAVAGG